MSIPDNTVPPPTPGDSLVGRVILVAGLVALVCVLGVIYLAATDKAVPQILESLATISVTGVVSLLAGRTQR